MISVIHNLYRRNPHVRESVALNVKALYDSKVAFQYICFNDHGDKEIEDDLADLINDHEIQYIYSDINYGKGVCSGGWVGAIPYLKGDYVHNTGQDDVFTPNFYRQLVGALDSDPNLSLAYANCIVTDPNLVPQNVMLPLVPQPIYYDTPFEAWKQWFGVGPNGPTRANNHFPAPGVIYRRLLHDVIGKPDVDNFLGAVDFEYWARILYHGLKARCFFLPLWLYRVSQHSTSKAINDADAKIAKWNEGILAKYQEAYRRGYLQK